MERIISGQESTPSVLTVPTREMDYTDLHIRESLPTAIESLTPNERLCFEQLFQAAKNIAVLFLYQTGGSDPERGTFYPPKDLVSKRRIEEEARKDPDLLSPYTVVILENNKLKAVPISAYYSSEIDSLNIVNYLRNAGEHISKGKGKDAQFAEYLFARADAFLTGDFETSERLWLKI